MNNISGLTEPIKCEESRPGYNNHISHVDHLIHFTVCTLYFTPTLLIHVDSRYYPFHNHFNGVDCLIRHELENNLPWRAIGPEGVDKLSPVRDVSAQSTPAMGVTGIYSMVFQMGVIDVWWQNCIFCTNFKCTISHLFEVQIYKFDTSLFIARHYLFDYDQIWLWIKTEIF